MDPAPECLDQVRSLLEPALERLLAAEADPVEQVDAMHWRVTYPVALDRAVGALVGAECLLDEAEGLDPDEAADRNPAAYARMLAELDPECGRWYDEIWRRHEEAQAARREAWAQIKAVGDEEIAAFLTEYGEPESRPTLRQPRANLTDTGNAERFAEDHAGRLLFVPGVGWHEWDGKRWAPDQGRGVAIEAAKRTARAMRDEARGLAPRSEP